MNEKAGSRTIKLLQGEHDRQRKISRAKFRDYAKGARIARGPPSYPSHLPNPFNKVLLLRPAGFESPRPLPLEACGGGT